MVLSNILKNQIKSDIKDDMEAIFLYGAVGTDNTATDASDTELGEEVFRKAIYNFDKTAPSAITASLLITTTEANDNSIKEAGLLNQDTNSVDTCEVANWSDSADMTTALNAVTFKEGSNSLSLTKDGTATATASTSKTTTSVNFTSKRFFIWLYIKDATMYAKLAVTDCITIRFGSDDSNYYVFTQDKANLAVGWNVITFTSATADSATGTPIITACDYTYVGITATGTAITWSAGDSLMDGLKVMGGSLYTRNVLIAITKTSDVNLYLDTTITIAVSET